MMIAKMILLVCVSTSRTVIKTDQTDDADNKDEFHLSVNSAGHVQPSTHSSEVSLHQSLIKESKPAAAAPTSLSNFRESAQRPETINSFATQFLVALARAVFGGHEPTAPTTHKNAKSMVHTMVTLRSNEGKPNLFTDAVSESLFTKYVSAWNVVEQMSKGLSKFLYETSLFIAMRTLFIDQQVAAISGSQIVFMGMELDTRALRFPRKDVVEVGRGEGFCMKVEATISKGEYPAKFVFEENVAGYIEALIESQLVGEGTAPLFVWESGAHYTPVDVTAELLSTIFMRFPSATIVFDSIEPGVVSSDFLATVAKALGKPEIFPGKFAMQDMVQMVEAKTELTVQVESVAVTDFVGRETVVPHARGFASYFGKTSDLMEFVTIFEHARFNVMSIKM